MHEGQLKTESLTESLDRLELEEEYSKGDPSRFDISVKYFVAKKIQATNSIHSNDRRLMASVSRPVYLSILADWRKTGKQ